VRRKNREFNIFSMSALDLFASAMGAFMLIALISLPYYLKTDHSLMAEANRQREEAERLMQEVEQARQAMTEYEQRALAAESQLQRTFLVVLVTWSTRDDVDLYLVDPTGATFWYENRRNPGRPGELSEDVIQGPGNEVWQTEVAQPGLYSVCIHRYRTRSPGIVQVRGSVFHKDGRLGLSEVGLARNQMAALGAVAVDERGNVSQRPRGTASCPQLVTVDYDPKGP
jgi:hypothetical protein